MGALEKEVKTAAEMRQCLLQGSQGRSTGATAMNQQSSRSHAIFTITLERTSRSDRYEIYHMSIIMIKKISELMLPVINILNSKLSNVMIISLN